MQHTAMHSWEQFKVAYSKGNIKVVFGDNFSIKQWAKAQGLKARNRSFKTGLDFQHQV